jgi:TrmH family RNA methyltransferase
MHLYSPTIEIPDSDRIYHNFEPKKLIPDSEDMRRRRRIIKTITSTPVNLFIDGIQDPGNLGSILRTAEAAGIKSVFLSKSSAELWSPKTFRGSQGAQLNLRCYESQDLLRLFDQVSLPIYSLSVCGDSLYGDDIPKDLILILGSEGGGINAEIISKSTKSISIPMHGSIESLNVGAAAGIFIYEYFRRHRLNVGD